MENIIDYLIVGFFIISFLSSFFKKKKPQKAKGKTTQQPAVKLQRDNVPRDKAVENKSRPQKKSSFEEILKAMLDVPEPVKEVHEEKSEVDAYFEEALKNSEIMEKETYKEEPGSLEDLPLDGYQLVEKEAQDNYFNAILDHHKKHTNTKALKIRNELLNNRSIKEYMIMNEILSKPLALRE